MLEIQAKASRPPDHFQRDEPDAMGTTLLQLRAARRGGRLIDPTLRPYRPWLEFGDRNLKHPPGWWNGLIYSYWQLLALPHLSKRLSTARQLGARPNTWVRLAPQHPFETDDRERLKRIALAITALEARYLPKLDPDLIRLSAAQIDQWYKYRYAVGAQTLSEQIEYDAEQASSDAQWLLLAANHLDPMGDWSELVKYADPRRWQSLRGDVLAALEHRIAAEILLLFIDELTTRGASDPIPKLRGNFWHPMVERLSYKPKTMDQVLDDLGVSPHPRAVLIVEGESEYATVPKVVEALNLQLAPDLVRVISMGGIHKDLNLIAAFAATPFVGEKLGDSYLLTRPPTHLMITVDPDEGFRTPDDVVKKRSAILGIIRHVLTAQGVSVLDDDLNQLVQIKTWKKSCFEFAHFTNEELVKGLREIDSSCAGLTDDKIIMILQNLRDVRQDIKRIWESWSLTPSKTALAEVLWPILEEKIQSALKNEGPLPQIADRVYEALSTAQQNRHLQFALRAKEPDPQ
jgi:hypothetical protein